MTAELSIPTAKELKRADRSKLIDYYTDTHRMSNEWIRRQVLENDRIDILATEVLGLQVQPFHLSLLVFQFQHPESLQLCFRGAGKSTTCTEVKIIHLLLKNPNLRILIASKTIGNAQGFLKNIKAHFETNTRLEEIFGKYYDSKRVSKWDDTEIEVLPRTIVAREASVTCVGVEGTVVSKHYDVIISDDLVDEDKSATKTQRDKVRKWFYNTLLPTLEPPDKKIPHRGEHHLLGTRYHYDDLYGHLIKNELKKHHNIIPALDEKGKSPWPEKYPAKWFVDRRVRSGLIIFNCHSDDTEFLTEDGWRLFDEVHESKLMTLSLGKGTLELQKPTHRISKHYEGDLLWMKNRGVDALVTPDHRMVARPLVGSVDREESWSFVPAKNLSSVASSRTKRVRLTCGGTWKGTEKRVFRIPKGIVKKRSHINHDEMRVDMDTFLRFIGYFVSEGSTSENPRGAMSFSQNIGLVADDIISTIEDLGFDPNLNKYTNDYNEVVCIGFSHLGLWEWLREFCGVGSGNKKIPRFVFELSSRQQRIVLEAAIAGDGSLNPRGSENSFWYTTISKQLNDDLCELALRCGISWYSRLTKSNNVKHADAWHSYGHETDNRGLVPDTQIKTVSYSGRVVCFTVPNGTLVTRRNGRVLVSGNCQYQCDTEAMKGEIFQYDHCQQLAEEDWPNPKKLRIWMGIDLAITEEDTKDGAKFAIVVIGVTKDKSAYYVLDYYEGNLRFKDQTEKIWEYYCRWKPIRAAIETNAYQKAQYHNLKDKYPGIRLKKKNTDKDKISRAWKLSAIFEDKRVFFRKGTQALLIEHMVLFPNHKYKDLFDAFDLAVNAKVGKRKSSREEEPGVI